jgi:hypothetical protein
MNLSKITNIYNKVNLQLRVDAFNVFNRVNLTGVNSDANAGATYGTSTGTNMVRQLQLSARINF